MRITNSMEVRNYLKRMNNNLGNLNKSNNRLTSQRNFDKASENVADATRALRVRRMLDKNDLYQNNIRDTLGSVSAAEENLKAVNKILEKTGERTIQAMNGVYTEDDLQKIATEVGNLQDEIMQISNSQYNGMYMFGSSGSADGKKPFNIVGGKLEYNGISVDDMIQHNGRPMYQVPDGTKGSIYLPKTDSSGKTIKEFVDVPNKTTADPGVPVLDANGKPVYEYVNAGVLVEDKTNPGTYIPKLDDGGNPITVKIQIPKVTGGADDPALNIKEVPVYAAYKEVPYNNTNHIDVGFGISVDGWGASAKLDTQSVLPNSYSGIELMGYGRDKETGMPNNVYSLLGRLKDDIMEGNVSGMGDALTAIDKQRSTLMVGITTIGNRYKFLEETSDRITNDTQNLQEQQSKVESVDLPEETMYNKSAEMAWMVTLQLGGKVLPTSLFDFLK